MESNLAAMSAIVDRAGAEKPDVILLTEAPSDRGVSGPLDQLAETIPGGPSTRMLAEKARRYRSYIVVSLHEKEGGTIYNTAVLLDRRGEVAGKYRKVHLATAEGERGITPGSTFPVFQTDFGKVGMLVCWDNWFPESARALRLKGAEIILLPIAGDGGPGHWDPISRARAIDNGVYLVSSSTYHNPSRKNDPHGEVLAETMDGIAVKEMTWHGSGASVALGRRRRRRAQESLPQGTQTRHLPRSVRPACARNPSKRKNQMIRSLLACLLFLGIAVAQDPRGSIIGRVTDSSNSAIPNVEVRATNSSTSVSAAARTNQAGNYSIPFLTPGLYTVTAELTGFKKYSRENIHLRVSETVELNLSLEVGQITESIDVKAETPLLDTASATLGQVVDERRILDLPTSGGNPVELAFLTPGVITNRSMIPMKAAFNGTAVSADGSPAFTNEFQLDGVSNTFAEGRAGAGRFSSAGHGDPGVQDPVDAVRCQRGHTIGAVITCRVPAGRTSFTGRGTTGRRTAPSTRPVFFNNKNNTRVSPYHDNRYGASGVGR
jgi:predicted amidohydrolase